MHKITLSAFCTVFLLIAQFVQFGCDETKRAVDEGEPTVDVGLSPDQELIAEADAEVDMELIDAELQIPDQALDLEPPADFPNQEGGNPINPESALYPYPSDFYLKANPNTATGFEVDFPSEVLLKTMPAAAFVGQDGFSRMPMILSAWPRGVDQASLASTSDHGPEKTRRTVLQRCLEGKTCCENTFFYQQS